MQKHPHEAGVLLCALCAAGQAVLGAAVLGCAAGAQWSCQPPRQRPDAAGEADRTQDCLGIFDRSTAATAASANTQQHARDLQACLFVSNRVVELGDRSRNTNGMAGGRVHAGDVG